METKKLYRTYSEFLKSKYGEKVYKLPINLPITCPNRIGGDGCIFCAEIGTGFEAMSSTHSVTEQLEITKELIIKKYHAHKFIAYFQNYTNTFMPLEQFEMYMQEAIKVSDIVELSIATRPDCIRGSYLDILKHIEQTYGTAITIELGLQTVNYHTLAKIHRGHGLAEYIDAVQMIKKYGFMICTHVILNLPDDIYEDAIETSKVLSALQIDIVKIHSLYIPKNTVLCDAYKNGTIAICSKDEYMRRLMGFLEYLSPKIVVERLFSRVPEQDAVFSNWGTSWWKLQDEIIARMEQNNSFQGKKFHYLDGVALEKL
ncbi:MAG: TIGR01212 family radical SAM protein [Lachnospiraceae bacterium]